MKIFVLNSGGSSVKFKLLAMPGEELIASGKVERLGQKDAVFHFSSGALKNTKITLTINDHKEAIKLILEKLIDKGGGVIDSFQEIDAIGHRVVHAGEKFTGSIVIDDKVITAIKECFDLAPLHNPPNVAGIEICKEILPNTAMVAVFDNAFHVDIPDYVRTYAIPYKYYEKYRVRKYGFHGITFEYMTGRTADILNKELSDLKIVSLMMGSGCTANAFKEGKSVEVSTGFTPLEGLVQSTRAGDVDPAAILYIMKKENLSVEEMDKVLNKESGWMGISEISNDLREIIIESEKDNKLAQLALRTTAHRAKKYVGAYSAIMGGIDALVFSGGVGENCAILREMVTAELGFLGLELDQDLNNNLKTEGIISTIDSKAKIIVVNTDEEMVIARDTYHLVG